MTQAYLQSYSFTSGLLNTIFDHPILLFVPVLLSLAMLIIGQIMRDHEEKRKAQEKAAAEARRLEAIERQNAERKAEREAELAAEEAEKQRKREQRKAERAAKAAAKAAMPKRPVGRPRKTPLPETPEKPSEPQPAAPAQEAPQEEQPKPHWPPRGNEAFNGQRVVLTGTLRMPQDEARAAIRKNGGTVQSSIQPSTTMLVTGEDADENALQWALDNGVRIVREIDFNILCSQPYDMTPEQFAAVAATL